MPQTPPIETSPGPWFGPRKRARELLRLRTHVAEPEEAVRTLCQLLEARARSIQRVRFIDFHHTKEDFRYTIAIVWTWSDDVARQGIYDVGEAMVARTGWYPLPQGERLGSRLKEISTQKIQKATWPDVDLLGPMKALAAAVAPEGGCSIRIRLRRGSLLLDAGLPGHLTIDESDRVVLLSHSHSDHFGGIETGRTRDLPVIMGGGTEQVLLGQRRLREAVTKSGHVCLSPLSRWRALGDGLEVRAFVVPHTPGSIGYALRDGACTVLYTGDIVMRTSRHDFLPTLLALIEESDRPRRWVLLDATMAGRSEGASRGPIAPEFFRSIGDRADIAVASRDPEQLLYAYLDLFHHVKKDTERRSCTYFLAIPELKPIFRVVHSAFITRELPVLDPILRGQYGSAMSSWAESRFLFWLHRRSVLPSAAVGKLRVWLVTYRELGERPELRGVPVVRIGRPAGEGEELDRSVGMDGLDTSPWTLHSDEECLMDAIRLLSERAHVVLFHNFPKRLVKFAGRENLKCQILTTEGCALESVAG